MKDIIIEEYNGNTKAYINEVLTAQDPAGRLYMDIEAITKTITTSDILENTAQLLAAPLLNFDDYETAINIAYRSIISTQLKILRSTLEEEEASISRCLNRCQRALLNSLRIDPLPDELIEAIQKRRSEISKKRETMIF